MQRGLSQEQLAQPLGITVPQLQKYEKGQNRIGASRLHRIAALLEAPIAFFFEVNTPAEGGPPAEPAAPDASVFADRATIELAMAFRRLASPAVRRALLELVRATASLEAGAHDGSDHAG
jgi:transcriptional regulator with XRE-family HTH domain